MKNEWVDPIFSDDEGIGVLCFDTCERFGEGCRGCERVKQANRNAMQATKSV